MELESDHSNEEDTVRLCCHLDHGLTDQELRTAVQLLSAMGNDTRYEALRAIAASDDGVCVCELPPVLGVSQGAVSQALSRLSAAGLVTRRKEGRWRYYSVTPQAQQLLTTLDDITNTTHD